MTDFYRYHQPARRGWARRYWPWARDLAGLVWVLFCIAFVLYGTTAR